MSFKRKLVISFFAAVMFTLIYGGIAFAENKTGVITGDVVNVRETASTSANIISQVSQDSEISIISETDGWYKTTVNGVTGWVSAQFVRVKTVIGTISGDGVNLREDASTASNVLTELSINTKVTVTGQTGEWYKVTYNGTAGWVNSKYLTLDNSTAIAATPSSTVLSGTITGDGVNLRNEAGTTSEVLSTLSLNERVSVIEKSGDWYKVKTQNSLTGWVFKNYIAVGSNSNTSRGTVAPPQAPVVTTKSTSSRASVVEYAKTLLGIKYVYGGTTKSGFDCSGFVQYVYNNFGIEINRVAADQATQGTYVKKAQLQPGDLVFFDTDGGGNYINHVGMYIGDGNFIHASSGSSAMKVTISNLNDGFYSNAYMTGRSFLK